MMNRKDCVCCTNPICPNHTNDTTTDLLGLGLIDKLSVEKRREITKAFAEIYEVSGSLDDGEFGLDETFDSIAAKESIERLVKDSNIEDFTVANDGELVVHTGIYRHSDNTYHSRPQCTCPDDSPANTNLCPVHERDTY
jgi:hypothetical protein